MNEMTPEKPWTPADCRATASNARLGGHSDVGEAFDLIASAWEADRARIEALKKERDILSGRLTNALARIQATEPDGWRPWPGEAIPPCNGPYLITLWHYGDQLTVETGWYTGEHREFFADRGHEISFLHVRAWRGIVIPYTALAERKK